MVKLECWSMSRNPFHAPELGTERLQGKVYGHPKYEDGVSILTAFIKSVDGKVVTTSSGRIYLLGEPDPKYVKWMKENNIPFDPEKPVRMRRVGGGQSSS